MSRPATIKDVHRMWRLYRQASDPDVGPVNHELARKRLERFEALLEQALNTPEPEFYITARGIGVPDGRYAAVLVSRKDET